ncbi:MAG: 50S ribosomal protein L35 [Firmicutes bacterium]|nr:50S ribosomal protein L35 [Bacillota bacterium]
MPKMRSHSGAKKRFRVTATGKVKIRRNNRNHILTKKAAKRQRDLRQNAYLASEKQAATMRSLIQK